MSYAEHKAEAAQAETAKANREIATALEKERVRVQQLIATLGTRPITELRKFNKTKRDPL